ncbi:hypothetical protein FACS189426_07090 [Bacteroidia bacterium]|nr:hypothetical protein FACS189426_07090 [Bacteroidia bacterium]GHV71624.1 hypothetical protein FACS189420_7350 [Bacteroidia bacterium]
MELKFEHFDYQRNLDEQRSLFRDCFPETDGEVIQNTEHYLWKFHSFPSFMKSWEYAAYYDNEMAGYYAALPYRYKIGKKEISVGMVCDVMTSSKQRGKGIFTKMGVYSTAELASQVPFTMGYPIRKEVIPGHLKVGWRIPFQLPLYMKFLRLNTLLKSRKIDFLAPLGNCAISVYNFFRQTKINKSYTCSMVDTIDEVEGYEEFTNRWNLSVPNALIKDLSFCRWRYSAPDRKYHFLQVKNAKNQLIALVVFRKILKENVPSYGILDYQVLPEYDDCLGIINKVLADKAKQEGVEAIMTMMSRYSAQKYQIQQNGYIKSPFVFSLIIKNLTNEFSETELFNEKDWHLMWVDSDDL